MNKFKISRDTRVLYIADTHFGHANIIRHCNRPFESAEEMDKAMIRYWNNVVGRDDVVFVVGDFSFRGASAEYYLSKLNSTVNLIIGNHDKPDDYRCFASHTDIAKVVHGDHSVILCHYPMAEWDGYYHGVTHFFGHIHNNRNEAAEIMDKVPNAYNIGADLLDFIPQTYEQIVGR